MTTIVTTCDRSYQPLLAAFLNSLAKNAAIALRVLVVEYDRLDRDFLRGIGPPVDFIDHRELGEFRYRASVAESPRYAQNYKKFLVWRLPLTGPLWYVDADVLCLRALHGIENYDHFGVVACAEQIGTPKGAVAGYARTVTVFNAGVFCFRPSLERFDEMQAWCQRYTEPHRHGDQVPLNEYFQACRPHEMQWMGSQWNLSIWSAIRHPYLFDLRGCKLLHYANVAKPHCDEPNRPQFAALWELWKEYEVK